MIWIDQAYNMVEMQKRKRYGRGSGVEFGPIDFVLYAESCGAKGIAVTAADGVAGALRQAMDVQGPVVISVFLSTIPIIIS